MNPELPYPFHYLMLTGSRVTTHFTEESGYDYVILVDDFEKAKSAYFEHGYTHCGHYDDGPYIALRKGHVNVLLSASTTYYAAMQAATTLLRELNLADKEARYELFHQIKTIAGIQ